MADLDDGSAGSVNNKILIRRVSANDLAQVVDLDARVTGNAKPDYWRDVYERYATRRLEERFFLVAAADDEMPEHPVLGYIVGEIRGWEFGSEPCGWIFAFSVEPETRQQGIGEQLFEAISDAFKQAGINKIRTMVDRKNQLHMAFFRSEGMVAGPYIQLEVELEDEKVN